MKANLSTLLFFASLLSGTAQAQTLPRDLGLEGGGPQGVEFLLAQPEPADPTLPEKWNWRNKDGQDWLTPVREQLGCGSCVAFGGISTLEAQLKIASGLSAWTPVLSVQSLFACGGGDCVGGWTVESAVEYMKNVGIPDEACLPYAAASGAPVCQKQCADVAHRSLKILNYVKPTRGTVDREAIQRALQQGPLWTVMTAYTDILNYRWGVYKHSEGSVWAGHTLAIIGYDNSKKAWLVKNSWGKRWGEDGYGLIHYDDTSGLGIDTWQLQLPSAEGFVAIDNLNDGDHISGAVTISLSSSRTDVERLSLLILDKSEVPLKTLECEGRRCVVTFDSGTFIDGVYELQAQMHLSDGATRSGLRTRIGIVNTPPKQSLTVSSPQLKSRARVSGPLILKVTTSTTSIPYSRLQFTVLQNGHVMLQKYTRDVRPEMVIRYDTSTLPDGDYEILVTADNDSSVQAARASVRRWAIQVKN